MTIKIQKTLAYNQFKRIEGNRGISKSHVNKLREAIRHNPNALEYNPILVNDKMEVINGQHRLEAAQAESVPVYYVQVEGLTLKDVQDLNAIAKVWGPLDYAHSYAEIGREEYAEYLRFKSVFGFNHDILMQYMALGETMNSTMFREGRFVVPDPQKSYEMCKALMDFAPYFERFSQRSFAVAFRELYMNEYYDHERMVEQLKNFSHFLQVRSVPAEYLRDLVYLYNHYRRDKIELVTTITK